METVEAKIGLRKKVIVANKNAETTPRSDTHSLGRSDDERRAVI
jgi:hypothetical protein